MLRKISFATGSSSFASTKNFMNGSHVSSEIRGIIETLATHFAIIDDCFLMNNSWYFFVNMSCVSLQILWIFKVPSTKITNKMPRLLMLTSDMCYHVTLVILKLKESKLRRVLKSTNNYFVTYKLLGTKFTCVFFNRIILMKTLSVRNETVLGSE